VRTKLGRVEKEGTVGQNVGYEVGSFYEMSLMILGGRTTIGGDPNCDFVFPPSSNS
jgi:hypothetical protein